jgi:superfamily I DNA/RNA helicase
MGTTAMTLLRAIAGPERVNDMFIVGDPFQSIYNKSVALSKCGINVRGRGKKLYINYRTTEEIRKKAISILAGVEVNDLDEGNDSNKGYTSILHGFAPQIIDCVTMDGEIAFISKYLDNVVKKEDRKIELKDICIISRTKQYLQLVGDKLSEKGIKSLKISKNSLDSEKEGIRLATMHRAKGLEFDTIIIVGLNAENDIPFENEEDKVVEKQNDRRERSLLYVAMTRAKREALMLYWGKRSRLLGNN